MLENQQHLSDIKILDFSHLLAGPFATQILAIMEQRFLK